MRHFDFIVLGQGLAGTALVWSLRWLGARVLVVDRESEGTASKIAAGLITPVTGKKLAPTWRHAELWPAAVSFYQRVEAGTESHFFHQPAMVRLFTPEDRHSRFTRVNDGFKIGKLLARCGEVARVDDALNVVPQQVPLVPLAPALRGEGRGGLMKRYLCWVFVCKCHAAFANSA